MTALRRLKGFRIAWIRLKLVESEAAVVDMIERCSSLFGLTKTSCCRHAMGYGLRRKAMSYMHSMPKLVHVGWTESMRSATDAKQPKNQI